jgi:polar amino acid transport system substrate-binding protein
MSKFVRFGIKAATSVVSVALVALLASCSATPAATSTSSALETVTAGKLTVGTGTPAYSPWVIDDKPESGKGFESAVAYAVAKQLGFAAKDVVWVRTSFDEAIAPGPKNFDFNLQQYSITPERAKNIDFSSAYYQTAQTVITVKGTKAAAVADTAGLKGLLLGAATGTTSYSAITDVIKPSQKPLAFNSNDDAKAALSNGQVDAIVVDLPTAIYLTQVELTGGIIIGQLPSAAKGDQFGLVLDKGSKLTKPVDQALAALKANGTLAALEAKWLTAAAGVPVLK